MHDFTAIYLMCILILHKRHFMFRQNICFECYDSICFLLSIAGTSLIFIGYTFKCVRAKQCNLWLETFHYYDPWPPPPHYQINIIITCVCYKGNTLHIFVHLYIEIVGTCQKILVKVFFDTPSRCPVETISQ